MTRRTQLIYLSIVLLLGLIAGPLLYLGSWAWQVGGCRRLETPGAYLAYCSDPEFGSYEHEAYRFGLEPEAVQAMQQAQVLFLGNSRLQFAFSTPQVSAFFGARGIAYHLLGFGYGESSRFPRELLQRYQPRPKVVIVNADPFFQAFLSPPAQHIAEAPLQALSEGWMKRLFDRHGALACRIPGFCSGTVPTTYRDRRSGQWIWHGILMARDTATAAITATKVAGWSRAGLPRWQDDARSLIQSLGVPPACVLLTGVPTPQSDTESMAAAIGAGLGVTVILPRLDGLTSSDNSHLSADSAERWSAAFMDAAAPYIEACLATETAQAATP